MKFLKNYLIQFSVLVILSLLSFKSFGQRIVMDSVYFPSPQIVCVPDTISFFFKTGLDSANVPPLPYDDVDIHLDLPDGYTFVDLIYTESIDSTDILPGSVISSDPNDVIFPHVSFLISPFSTLFELKVVVVASCGANTSRARAFMTKNYGGSPIATPVSDTIISNNIGILEPYLVFQGVSNTTNSNASINLNRLAIGQKIQRCFKIDYTSLISSIDQVQVSIPNTNNYFSFDWVTPGVSTNVVNDTVYYTFGPAFFATIGDGDGVIEPGESFTFCDSVTVLGNCSSQNSNVKMDYTMSWGCGGSDCQSSTVAAEGIIALSPTQIRRIQRPDLYIAPDLCDTCGSGQTRIGFEFINQTQAVLPSGGFLTDVVLELGTAAWPYSVSRSPNLLSDHHCFDSVLINGVSVPFTSNSAAAVLVKDLTSFSGSGLQDLNGDGFFDDLASGDTLVVELYGTFFARKHDTSALTLHLSGGNQNVGPALINAIQVSMDIQFSDECEGNRKQERLNSGKTLQLDPRNSSSSIVPDFFDNQSYVLNMSMGEWNTLSNYDCDSALRQLKIIVPKDVSIDNSLPNPFSNYPSTSSTVTPISWVERDGLNDVDTIYVWWNTKGVNTSGSFNVNARLRYDCSGGVCPEADSLRTIQWIQSALCIDINDAACYESAMYRGKRLVRFHCDLPPQGISLRTFRMERATFGWTDSTETTRVNRTTPGIDLEKAQVADTVLVELRGVVNDAVLDSAHVRFSYHTQFGQAGVKQIFRMDTINSTVTIYDASSATFHTFRLHAPGKFSGEFGPQQAGSSHNYDWQWNLSAYKDSIGGGYQFTGGSGVLFDSVNLDIKFIIEDNSYSGGFHIDPFAQMVELPEDTATQCDIYGQLFRVWQYGMSFGVEPAGMFTGCETSVNRIEVYNGNTGDVYPNEYKRNEELEEMRFSWNPQYFNDPDSVMISYRWGTEGGNLIVNKKVSFTQVGNTITIPLERSGNVNVFPEVFGPGYSSRLLVSVFQVPTCSVKDSMSPAELGVKGELDVSRFTNSGSPNTLTYYDTNSLYGGANMVFTNITPFNITSSPIVASTSSDSVCWEVSYQNMSFQNMNTTWLDFSSDSLFVSSIVRIDSGLSVPQTLLNYGTNGLWMRVDTIESLDYKTYKVCAQYTSCKLDSLIVTGGWNCDQYPTDPTTGYPPIDYTCEHNQQQVAVYIDELEAKLQVNVVSQTPMPINLCDTLFYDVQIANIDLTDLKDLKFSAILPSLSNVSSINGTSELIWPYDGVNTIVIPLSDPTVFGDSLVWDLTGQFSSSKLKNFEEPNDSNYALVKLAFSTNCITYPGEDIRFNVEGTRGCNQVVYSKNAISNPFEINGLRKRVNRLTQVKVKMDTIQ